MPPKGSRKRPAAADGQSVASEVHEPRPSKKQSRIDDTVTNCSSTDPSTPQAHYQWMQHGIDTLAGTPELAHVAVGSSVTSKQLALLERNGFALSLLLKSRMIMKGPVARTTSKPELLHTALSHGLVLRGGTLRQVEVRGAAVICQGCSSGSGSRCLTAGEDGTLRVWDTDSSALWGKHVGQAGQGETCDGALLSLTMLPDGRRMMTTHKGGKTYIHDIESDGTCKIMTVILGDDKPIVSAAVYADQKRVILIGADGGSRFWDISKPESAVLLKEAEGQSSSVAVFPGDQQLALATKEGRIELWKLQTGERAAETIAAHHGPIGVMVVFPDGAQILTAGVEDGKLLIWKLHTRSGQIFGVAQSLELQHLEGAHNRVLCAQASPCNSRAVTGEFGGTVRWWDTDAGELLSEWPAWDVSAALRAGDHAVNVCALFPDSRILVAGAKGARVWRLPAALLAAQKQTEREPVIAASEEEHASSPATPSRPANLRVEFAFGRTP